MAIKLHAALAAAMLCASGLAGVSHAQVSPQIGGVAAPATPAVPRGAIDTPAIAPPPAAAPSPIEAPAAPEALAPVPAPAPAPEAIGPAPSAVPPLPPVPGTAQASPSLQPGTSSLPQGAAAPQPAPGPDIAGAPAAENGLFGLDLKNTSTRAAGLSRTARARVAENERTITSELNRASAASTGNANPAMRAAVPGVVNTP